MIKRHLLALFLSNFILFVSPSFSAPAVEELRLEGIIEDQNDNTQSMAVINGDLFQAGEKVGEFQIEKIQSSFVSLKNLKTGQEMKLIVKEAPKAAAAAAQGAGAPSLLDKTKQYLTNPSQAVNRGWEMLALRDLSIINNAAVKYFETNKFFPVQLRQLTLDGFLPVSYESGKAGKYEFYLKNKSEKPSDLQLHADPVEKDKGLRFFFVGPDAMIRESTGKPADAKSPEHEYPGKQPPVLAA